MSHDVAGITNSGLRTALLPSREELDVMSAVRSRNDAQAEMFKSQKVAVDNDEKRKRIDAINKYLTTEPNMPEAKRRSLEVEKYALM